MRREGLGRAEGLGTACSVPSDHENHTFPFYVSRRTQAAWLRMALRVTRRWPRIYTLGWIGLYDEPPVGSEYALGQETNWGLLDWQGLRKPAYLAYKRG